MSLHSAFLRFPVCGCVAAQVYACEWNPNALACLRANLSLNRIAPARCDVLPGDNRAPATLAVLSRVADRVMLGLLPSAEASWHVALEALKDSGR